MSFNRWLALYKNAAFVETRVSLLSYLEQGNVKFVKQVECNEMHSDIINNVLKRVYAL
jgi:hypothetical protein